MALKASLADFVVKTDDGYIPSDTSCEALDRFNTKEEKALKDAYYKQGADRAEIRKRMFVTPGCSRRMTQHGLVPVKELRSGSAIPSALKKLITKWLLDMLNDEDNGETAEKYIIDKFPDVLISADKLSRLAQRLEDDSDLIHESVGFQTLAAAACAIPSTVATEGKCEIVRATEDAIIARFDPVPEHLNMARHRGTFFKAFPVNKNEPMVYGVKALSGLSNRDFIMFHGHGHLRTVPYNEIPDAIKSFSRKQKEEITKIMSDPIANNAGDRFLSMCNMILQSEKIETIIQKTMKPEKKQ
ncbi:NSP2 [Rotavirus J]|uniref:NSP2 n=1 Tax=Rotavirus J TaxID=1929964 RepID=A0A1L6BXK2_9REOV|nr:NSP2 [Rotavirus J]APQ41748.1 NSP2 [Rotavirus J]